MRDVLGVVVHRRVVRVGMGYWNLSVASGLGVVPVRVADGYLIGQRVDPRGGHIVPADALPVHGVNFLPEAQQQHHVLAALHLLHDPVPVRRLDRALVVRAVHAVVDQVLVYAALHVHHVGAVLGRVGALAVGVHQPGEVVDERQHVLRIVVVPYPWVVRGEQTVVIIYRRRRCR